MIQKAGSANAYRELLDKNRGYKEFCGQFEDNVASHAYILESTDKLFFVDLLLCCASKVLQNTTSDATALVLARTHPDVEIYPEESKKKMSVEDVKNIISSAYTKPIKANKKVFCIVASSGQSGDVWQNKLLKILEEPPQNVCILIAVQNSQELLNTVRSRCQIIKIGNFEEEDLASFINKTKNLPMSKSREIARLSNGSIEKAQYIAGDSNYMNCLSDVLYLLGNMTSTRNMAQFLPIVAKYKDSYADFLEIMQNVLFDAYLVGRNDAQPLNLFKKDAIIKIANLYTDDALLRSVAEVEKAKKQLDDYASYVMVMDGLLLKILEVRYLCRP